MTINIHRSVIFTVEDNGIGIQPENIDGLFKKFYQIDTGLEKKIWWNWIRVSNM